jgi:hypothetical protein
VTVLEFRGAAVGAFFAKEAAESNPGERDGVLLLLRLLEEKILLREPLDDELDELFRELLKLDLPDDE